MAINFPNFAAPLAIVADPGARVDIGQYISQIFSGGGYSSYWFYNDDDVDGERGFWNTTAPSTKYFTVGGVAQAEGFFNVSQAQLDNVELVVGNQICNRILVQVNTGTGPGAGDSTWSQFWIDVIPDVYEDQTPNIINGSDVVAAARAFGARFAGSQSPSGCHDIARALAAAAGAPLPIESGSLVPAENIDGGLWTVVHRGDSNPDPNWQVLLQPGDIVRYDYSDPSQEQHTFTVLSISGNLVETFDNFGQVLNFHSTNFAVLANPATVTIYRITSTLHLLEGNAGDDFLSGSIRNDLLRGLGGDDTLNGGIGADRTIGGQGNDSYFVDNAGDVVVEVSAQGADQVFTSVSYTLGAGQSIESFATTNNAGTAAINLTGNALSQSILGNAGNNRLDGGGGNDTLTGLAGNDQFFVDSASDQVIEGAGQGADRVFASVSYALGPGQSIELFSTTNSAGATAINLTGNEFANTILGNAGNNTLNGGAGIDTLTGLGGNDYFFVDHASDRAVEAAGQGSDRVFASVSYALGAGQSIELFSTTNSAGTAAINLTGNELAQAILGNAGNNTLNGGAGADTLTGLGGNDYFIIDSASDRTIEAAGQGTDRVFASVSYALGPGQSIELFSTTNSAGATAINLTGNEFANTILGNAGNNTLNGGAGIDTLTGLGGNDYFFVDHASDRAVEAAGQGSDRVFASVSYALGAGQSIELFSTTNNAGAGTINLTGNEFAQAILGNAGNNTLNGGAGSDTLTGGLGNDFFLFGTALSAATNVDRVVDFNVAADTIRLASTVFFGLGNNATLAGSAFRIGAAAADADDHIIYNSVSGALFFDSNGNASGGATQFATLAPGLALTDADFFVV